MSFSFGDVILVPFPFTDQSGAKKRPAVVVSSDELHRESIDLVIMAITTQARASSALQVPVSEWQAAGLLRPSVVKPVFATIERSLVVKTIGALQPNDLDALRNTLRRALAFEKAD
jgi:mRNA interferase MazF